MSDMVVEAKKGPKRQRGEPQGQPGAKVMVAVLDEGKALVGLEEVTAEEAAKGGRVVVDRRCDLPHDGTYKWDDGAKAFQPLGHGFGRPMAPTVDLEQAVHGLVRALQASGVDVGPEAIEWADWLKENGLRQLEERSVRMRRSRQATRRRRR